MALMFRYCFVPVVALEQRVSNNLNLFGKSIKLCHNRTHKSVTVVEYVKIRKTSSVFVRAIFRCHKI